MMFNREIPIIACETAGKPTLDEYFDVYASMVRHGVALFKGARYETDGSELVAPLNDEARVFGWHELEPTRQEIGSPNGVEPHIDALDSRFRSWQILVPDDEPAEFIDHGPRSHLPSRYPRGVEYGVADVLLVRHRGYITKLQDRRVHEVRLHNEVPPTRQRHASFYATCEKR